MNGINKVILLGHLGNDPETKFTKEGASVTSISIATSEKWNDKDGNKQEKTEWHRVVFFGRLAEIASQYLKKGSGVYVEGKNQTQKWTDENGKDHYTTQIVAREMQMLPSKSDGANQGGFIPRNEQQQNQPAQQQNQTAQTPAPNFDDFDDEIPY